MSYVLERCGFVGKGVGFIGKPEAWIPSLVFYLDVILEVLAEPLTVTLRAQLFVVADMRTGQKVTTPAMISVPSGEARRRAKLVKLPNCQISLAPNPAEMRSRSGLNVAIRGRTVRRYASRH